VLLEALTCGCAVVASRTAGNAEDILENGRYGRLVDPLDAAAMSEALLAQLDPAKRVSPGGRVEAYDRRHTLSRYRELFNAVRDGTPASHRP
jgi:glycosyltransferase involved in cell wall biosynthesis